ncbi:MAG: type II secretion system F family protein [Pseudomonadota bacterium]
MPAFDYTAMDKDGVTVSGAIQSADRDGAMAQIESAGMVVVALTESQSPATGDPRFSIFRSRITVPSRDVTSLISDLADLLEAQLRLDAAIELIIRDIGLGRVQPMLNDILASLRGGDGFADALAKHPTAFDAIEIEMIRLAETDGSLPSTLRQILINRERRQKTADQVSGALRYPMFLLLGATLVVIFFLLHVIPQFEFVIADAGGTEALGLVFSISQAVRANSDAILIGLLIVLVGGWILSTLPQGRSLFRAIVMRLPLVSDVVRSFRCSKLCYLISQTQEAGVGLPAALKLIGPAVDGPFENRISTLAVDGLRQGRKLADVLEEFADLPALALRMIRIGEESSQLAALTGRAAAIYEAKAERRLTTLVGIVGPATLIFISFVIGGTVVLIMNALLSVNEAVFL